MIISLRLNVNTRKISADQKYPHPPSPFVCSLNERPIFILSYKAKRLKDGIISFIAHFITVNEIFRIKTK